MKYRIRYAVGFFGLISLGLNDAWAAPQSLNPSVQIRFLLNANSGSKPIRLVKDPQDNTLYYLKQSGSIYRVTLNSGSGTSTSTLVYSSTDDGITAASGLAIGPNGTLYVVGNTTTNSGNSTFATVMKGATNAAGGRTWSLLAQTELFPLSRTAFDHQFNGIVASPDGDFVYLNSGARTDHGEEQSAGGVFPGTRDVPLTAKIFRLPANGSNLILSNNLAALQSAGYIFAEGVRNSYDLAFGPNGDLFATENGPDRDMSEELNWIRQGLHYGFPWRMGGLDNPQQFPNYDPTTDLLLDPRYTAVQNGFYHNDPTFPPPPAAFAEPVINLGPDADSYRDPGDGSIKDASALGQTLSTFTAHRSPLGLVFDTAGVLTPEFRNHGFMLSWTAGDASGNSVPGPFNDPGQDLLDLDLTKLGNTNYQARVTRIVGGFANPIDAEIIVNHIYVLEYGGSNGIWEITLPLAPTISTDPASQVTATTATLNGTVNPNGAPASAWFEWGVNTNFGTVTSTQTIGSGAALLQISQDLSGLLPASTYHFRIAASNDFTVAYGTDATFTTTNQHSAPVAQNDTATTSEDSLLTLPAANLLANDTDSDPGDTLTLISVSAASAPGGTVNLSAGSVIYSPTTNFFGNDSFSYVVSDSFGLTATGTVMIVVAPVNDSPVAVDDVKTTPEDTPLTFSATDLTANDSAGPANESNQMLTVTSVNSPGSQGGIVTFTNGSITYLPPTHFFGTETFTYRITDSQTPVLEASATVTVTVTPVNDPPVVILTSPANNSAYTSHSTIALIATASDVDGVVARVGFYTNSALMLTVTNGAAGVFSVSWTNIPAGTYSVTAEAADDQNAINTSATINFSVVDLRLDLPAMMSNRVFRFDLTGAPGNSYRVDASTNLQNWDPMTNALATNGSVQITDPAATNYERRYYRAVAP